MTEQTPSAVFAYIAGDDRSDIALLTAQLEHMGGALSRELSINAEAERTISRLTAERDGLRKALERIERWFGEFPETGQFWDRNKSDPMSYAAFGSNGERDFMRGIARAALATPTESDAVARGGE